MERLGTFNGITKKYENFQQMVKVTDGRSKMPSVTWSGMGFTRGQSCRTRVLDLDSSRTRVRFLADLDLDLDSVVKDSDLDLDLDIACL